MKSLEEYLAGLEFDAGEHDSEDIRLTGSERAFVEKYLGLDALEQMPYEDPEPIPLLEALDKKPELPFAEPEIIVVPGAQTTIVTPEPVEIEKSSASVKLETKLALPLVKSTTALPVLLAERPVIIQQQIITVTEEVSAAIATQTADPVHVEQNARPVRVAEKEKLKQAAGTVQKLAVKARAAIQQRIAERARLKAETRQKELIAQQEAEAVRLAEQTEAIAAEITETEIAEQTETSVIAEDIVATREETIIAAKTAAKIVAPDKDITKEKEAEITETAVAAPETVLTPPLSEEAALKEHLKAQTEVLVVSFFVSDQIFLLPVIGIREVLRHMELIKVPQAPEFIAGAINLRGRVTPVVHLSALLTNGGVQPYDEKKFIIVAGTDALQLGLIIDKVSSMHLVPQDKFIWNPESKLADAAEFLNAIVTLDDRVCGMVSPETITKLILSEQAASNTAQVKAT